MERRLGPTGPSNRLWVIRVLLSGVAVFFKREKKKDCSRNFVLCILP